MSSSKIEWTETTWNPLTGCTKISPGCKNCYAERMARRLQAMNSANYANGFTLTCHPHALDIPFSWKKERMVFVNSMSDLFHEAVPESFIKRVFNTMNLASQHQYQVLTKRSERLLEMNSVLKWDSHIWAGVSVENKDYTYRIDHLRRSNAKVKFISFEPLIGDAGELNLNRIDWVIVGGESGPGARPMEKEWVITIQQQCMTKNIPFFFKQWGGVNKKKTGRLLDGRIWDQMPEIEIPSPDLAPA